MPKVDIVVPCYNYGRFLEECVRSILEQSVKDVRVLIIDDASADDSVSVARRLAEADPRVSVIAHSENKGHISTYNEGIEWISADYFLLLSADDLLVPGALERAARIMDENPDVVLTFGKCTVWRGDAVQQINFEQNGMYVRRDLIKEMCATATNFIPTPTAIVRTRTQKAIGGYRSHLPHSGDMEMWLRFAASGAVVCINEVQGIYRKHSTAMSNSYFDVMLSDYRQRKDAFDCFFREYGVNLPEGRALQALASQGIAREAFRSGILFLRRGRIKPGVALLHWSMNLDPKLGRFPPLWQLLKIPGPEGRSWAMSTIKSAAGKLLGRAGHN